MKLRPDPSRRGLITGAAAVAATAALPPAADAQLVGGYPAPVLLGQLPRQPYLDFRFLYGSEAYILNGQRYADFTSIPGATSTGGAGFGTVQRNGVWQSVPANAPLIGDGGLGVWEARTNSIRNPVMAGTGGAKGGTGTINGDVPNNMEVFAASGLTVNFSKMTIDGHTFLVAEVSGTPTTSPHFQVYPEQASVVAATNGQTWTAQAEIAVIAGSVSALGAVTQRLALLNSGGTSLGDLIGSDFKSSIGPEPGEFRYSATTNNASTAFVRPYIAFSGAGSPVSYTVAIGLPNLKLGADINDPPILQTSGLAATRTAVAQSVTGLVLPGGDFDIEQTFRLGPSGVTSRAFEYHNGTDAERILCNVSTGGSLSAFVVGGGSVTQIGASSSPLAPGAEARVSVRRRGSNWQFIVNEAQSGGHTAAGAPSVNAVIFGQRRINTEVLNSTIQRHRLRAA